MVAVEEKNGVEQQVDQLLAETKTPILKQVSRNLKVLTAVQRGIQNTLNYTLQNDLPFLINLLETIENAAAKKDIKGAEEYLVKAVEASQNMIDQLQDAIKLEEEEKRLAQVSLTSIEHINYIVGRYNDLMKYVNISLAEVSEILDELKKLRNVLVVQRGLAERGASIPNLEKINQEFREKFKSNFNNVFKVSEAIGKAIENLPAEIKFTEELLSKSLPR